VTEVQAPIPSRFVVLLQEQVGVEFAAHQQYIALAVWFEANDLPRLATLFYRQAVEERNHAMMMVQYLLDRGIPPHIPGIGPVEGDFSHPRELIDLALRQEQEVTALIERLFKAARDDGDFVGEQFMLWFLKEQVEEVSGMTTLLAIMDRAGNDFFQVENFLARESVGDGGKDPASPRAAGGGL
jgi:ferritin